MAKMRAAVFVEPGRIVLEDKPITEVGPLDALVRVTTATICREREAPKARHADHSPQSVAERMQ
jgi:hypothetical protein